MTPRSTGSGTILDEKASEEVKLMSITPMWKYQKKASPIPGPQIPRRTYLASLACGMGLALLFATAAFIAPKGIRVECRAVLLGFAAFYALELPSLLGLMSTKRAMGRRIHLSAIALPVFCLLSILIMAAILAAPKPPDSVTHARILILGAINVALALALTVYSRVARANLATRRKLHQIRRRLAAAITRGENSSRQKGAGKA